MYVQTHKIDRNSSSIKEPGFDFNTVIQENSCLRYINLQYMKPPSPIGCCKIEVEGTIYKPCGQGPYYY